MMCAEQIDSACRPEEEAREGSLIFPGSPDGSLCVLLKDGMLSVVSCSECFAANAESLRQI